MTHSTVKATGFIDSAAVEQQARVARAAATREVFAALAGQLARLATGLRPARPLAGNGQPRTRAFA
jgi:hypothetical protein